MSGAVAIPAGIYDALVEHARADAPNECCGLLEFDADGGHVTVAHPMENIAASPMRFELGSADLLKLPAIEESGRTPVIYHSHTRSEPYPSQTDLNFAAYWPGVPWLIIGVDGEPATMRWYEIEDGAIGERPVRRTEG